MAVIAPTSDSLGSGVTVYTWESLTEADTASPVQVAGAASASIQVTGSFGSGGTLDWEGTHVVADGYHVLKDMQSVDVSPTAAVLVTVLDLPIFVRPNVSDGTSVSLKVTLLVKI